MSTLLACVNEIERDVHGASLLKAVELAVADTSEESYWTHVDPIQ
jgi:hypothetical protein